MGIIDAHVGAWFTIQARPGVLERHTANGDAQAAVLLLLAGLPQQHRPSESEAIEGLPNASNALQTQAWNQAFYV